MMPQPVSKRGFEPRDIFRLKTIEDVQLSPDGSRVAWAQKSIDKKVNEYRSHIYVANIDSGDTHRFTSGPFDYSPRWSPDGRFLAFLSWRTEQDSSSVKSAGPKRGQVFVMPAAGGEAWRLTRLRYGVEQLSWSPTGDRLALRARINPERGVEPLDDTPADDPYEKFNEDVKVIDRVHYRQNGIGYFGDQRYHLLMLPFDSSSTELPEVQALTCGHFDVEDPAWSPNGTALAFSGNLDQDADLVQNRNLYVVSAAGSEPREVIGLDGPVYSPSWSPNGEFIAFLGHDWEHGRYSDTRLWVVPAAGGEAKCLTADFDNTLNGNTPVWAPDQQSLLVSAVNRGTARVWRATVTGHEVLPVTPESVITSDFALGSDQRRLAVIGGTSEHPGDIYIGALQASGDYALERLTSVNADLLDELALPQPEEFWFDSAGTRVQGWVIKPVGYQPGKQYPTVVSIHGGPRGMSTFEFSPHYQVLAAAGYVLVYTNPRGSTGYGQQFSVDIRSDWGNLDYRDIMNGVAYATESFEFVDSARMGVTGGSYGGFMTNWIIGHEHGTFKAAISEVTFVNKLSSFGTSDSHYRRVDDFGGTPWELPEKYLQQSPLLYLEGCDTPTLVICAENDYRCPIEQGEQLFTALKLLGVPTRFIRFPGESHSFSRIGQPWHRVFRYEHVLEWFGRYLKEK